jgi:hypothetical protein
VLGFDGTYPDRLSATAADILQQNSPGSWSHRQGGRPGQTGIFVCRREAPASNSTATTWTYTPCLAEPPSRNAPHALHRSISPVGDFGHRAVGTREAGTQSLNGVGRAGEGSDGAVDIPRRFIPPGAVSVETDGRVGAVALSFSRPLALFSLHVVSSGGLTCCTSNNINSCRRVMTSPDQAMPCHVTPVSAEAYLPAWLTDDALRRPPPKGPADMGPTGMGTSLPTCLPLPLTPEDERVRVQGDRPGPTPGSFRVRMFNNSPPRSSSPVTRSPGQPAGEADCGQSRHAGFCSSARCCRCVAVSVASAAVDE